MLLAHLFVRVVMPVFVVIGMGYVYARLTPIDVRPMSRIAWYISGPCLGFASLATSTVPNDDLWRLVLFMTISSLVMWPLARLTARGLRLERQTIRSFELSTLFGNVVNYGFPVLLFAFGQEGLERGVIIMLANSFLLSTLAVFIASSGHSDWRGSLATVFKMPMLYAGILGLVVNRLGITIPKPIFDPIYMVGQANLMLLLLVLGIQLAQVKLADGHKAVVAAVVLRLGVAVAVGVVVGTLLGLKGLSYQVAIVESGVPTAVYATIIATEFDVAPGFAAAVIFVSTIASMGTLTLVLALLGVR